MSSIPDDELEQKVMDWMWNKFNADWSNQQEVMEALPRACQNVYSCRTIIDEVENGGLNQLFFNSTSDFAPMACQGFSEIGSQELSKIMADAMTLFVQNVNVLKKYHDGTLESFSASYDEKIFDELDNEFYAACKSFNMESYIRLNQGCFGD